MKTVLQIISLKKSRNKICPCHMLQNLYSHATGITHIFSTSNGNFHSLKRIVINWLRAIIMVLSSGHVVVRDVFSLKIMPFNSSKWNNIWLSHANFIHYYTKSMLKIFHIELMNNDRRDQWIYYSTLYLMTWG